MRYYSTQRPITPGSYPKENVISIENFDDKKYVSEIGGDAWGYVEYDCELPEEKVRAYEFTPVNPMHCTAKQLAAMKRILSRGQKAMNAAHVSGSSFLVSGQQFCEHGYAITDGGVTAFLPAYAPGIPYATKYEADAVYRVFWMRLVTAIISPLIWTMFGMIHQTFPTSKNRLPSTRKRERTAGRWPTIRDARSCSRRFVWMVRKSSVCSMPSWFVMRWSVWASTLSAILDSTGIRAGHSLS